MDVFNGSIDMCVKQAWDNPMLIQRLNIKKPVEHAFLLKLLNEDPSLVKILDAAQFSEEVYLKMLDYDLELFYGIPKGKRSEAIKLKALSIDETAIYMLSDDEISYECVKYVYIRAPFILEEAPKSMKKAMKNHMKRIKKEGVVMMYNEDEEDIDELDLLDLPDYD